MPYSPLGWFAQTKVSNSIVGGGLNAGRVITEYLVKEQDGKIYRYGEGGGEMLRIRFTDKGAALHVAKDPRIGAGERSSDTLSPEASSLGPAARMVSPATAARSSASSPISPRSLLARVSSASIRRSCSRP